MAVKLVPKFKPSDIKKQFNIQRERVNQAILLRLQRIGERFVANARRTADFTDRTGNLRSSIGYVILRNGVQIYENFQQKSGGPSGVSEAQKAIAEVARKHPNGFVIIGVAGMDYAAAVESKGYDVITSSAKQAEIALETAIKELSNKIAGK